MHNRPPKPGTLSYENSLTPRSKFNHSKQGKTTATAKKSKKKRILAITASVTDTDANATDSKWQTLFYKKRKMKNKKKIKKVPTNI